MSNADDIPPLVSWQDGLPVLNPVAAAARAVSPQVAPDALPEETVRMLARLERYGVSYQDAALVAQPHLLMNTDALRWAKEFVDGAGGPLGPGGRALTMCVLAGSIGTGKTTAAVYVLANGRPRRMAGAWSDDTDYPKFRHAHELVAASTLLGGDDEKSREVLRRTKLLVIDDLGMEQDRRGLFIPFLDWLIDERYGAPGWTVLTTNLTLDAFRERYGLRIYDRLKHRAAWYEIAHQSLRGPQAPAPDPTGPAGSTP